MMKRSYAYTRLTHQMQDTNICPNGTSSAFVSILHLESKRKMSGENQSCGSWYLRAATNQSSLLSSRATGKEYHDFDYGPSISGLQNKIYFNLKVTSLKEIIDFFEMEECILVDLCTRDLTQNIGQPVCIPPFQKLQTITFRQKSF